MLADVAGEALALTLGKGTRRADRLTQCGQPLLNGLELAGREAQAGQLAFEGDERAGLLRGELLEGAELLGVVGE